MSRSKETPISGENRLLASLPLKEYDRILSSLKLVHLAKGKILYQAGDTVGQVYFPLGGLLSLLSLTENGATIEVATVGNEGLVGLPVILHVDRIPYQVMVQIPADTMQIRADVLKELFNRGGQLQALLLKYTHSLLTQISQTVVCNRFHRVEVRFCRCLLGARDRANSDTLYLTQEIISYMLGVPRTSVTAIASMLQRAGVIRYSRGRIQILDPQGLGGLTCECYRIIREEIDQSLAA